MRMQVAAVAVHSDMPYGGIFEGTLNYREFNYGGHLTVRSRSAYL